MRKCIIVKLTKCIIADMNKYRKLGELLAPLSIDNTKSQYSFKELYDCYKIFPAILLKSC